MDDIDREVAEKVMGWVVHQCGPIEAYLVGGRIRWPSEWSPSTRVDHAWEVVEKMAQRGLKFQLTEVGNEWHASFRGNGLIHNGYGYATNEYGAMDAVCSAALEAAKNG